MKTFFASTSKGFEEMLKAELHQLGIHELKIVQGGVIFQAIEEKMYKTLLWSRLASRIFLPLSEFSVFDETDLYFGASNIRWDEIFDLNSTFSVHFIGENNAIRHSKFGALRVKDAIVDYFMRKKNRRPNVEKILPDIRIHVYLNKNKATLSLDLSGESLHQRGYRQTAGFAPMKENLATATLIRSGWKPGIPLVDPMCGSGTLLIEAAMIASNYAPGLLRNHWGFLAWKKHNQDLWKQQINSAKNAINDKIPAEFFGFDNDKNIIEKAKQNARLAQVSHLIHFSSKTIADLTNPISAKKGVIVTNPPYGERLENQANLITLYNEFGTKIKSEFPGWNLSLISASNELLNCVRLRANRQFHVKNGALDCIQKNYSITDFSQQNENKTEKSSNENVEKTQQNIPLDAIDFANRLRKNMQKIEKWAKKEKISCFRLYDADLPEFNVAIDKYNNFLVIQEYSPPKTIDPQKARKRLFDLIQTTKIVTNLPSNHIFVKTRQKQKDKSQYEKLEQKREFIQVSEFNSKFWVNLIDYLDTGLFLDHRITRRLIGELSKNKDFLNLFAYTGTASVYAALGGAKSTTTVDMSKTYLNWARENFILNQIPTKNHQFIQADCLQFLDECNEKFDLIFVDPPTFSNSKRMENTFDVQRDHIEVLIKVKKLLRENGMIIFSNNKQNFKLDENALNKTGLFAQNISHKTTSFDFSRKNLHHCWLISKENT